MAAASIAALGLAACGSSHSTSDAATTSSKCNPSSITVTAAGKVTSPAQCRFKGQTLSVAVSAGTYTQLMQQGVGKIFKEATGATINWVPDDSDTALTQIEASKGSTPPFDVESEMENTDVAKYRAAGVIQKIDTSALSYASKIPANATIPNYLIGMHWFNLGICYNSAEFSSHDIKVDGLQTLFDPKLAGKVMFPQSATPTFEIAMPAIAQALENSIKDPTSTVNKLASIKGMQLYETSAQDDQALDNGSAWAGLGSGGRCFADKTSNHHLAFAPLNMKINGRTYGYIGVVTGVSIMKGTKKLTLAEIYMNLAATVPAILAVTDKLQYPPTNTQALNIMARNPTYAPVIRASGSPNSYYAPDYTQFVKYLSAWDTAFNSAVQR